MIFDLIIYIFLLYFFSSIPWLPFLPKYAYHPLLTFTQRLVVYFVPFQHLNPLVCIDALEIMTTLYTHQLLLQGTNPMDALVV